MIIGIVFEYHKYEHYFSISFKNSCNPSNNNFRFLFIYLQNFHTLRIHWNLKRNICLYVDCTFDSNIFTNYYIMLCFDVSLFLNICS